MADSMHHSNYLFDRVHLLWVKDLSKLHQRLSFNVIREICIYLEDCRLPILTLKDRVLSVDVQSGRFKSLILLKTRIHASVSVFVGANKIVVCGVAHKIRESPSKCAYLLEEDGTVHNLPDMREGRALPGVVYNANKNSVLVFGGAYKDKTVRGTVKALNSNEKFSLSELTWEDLPSTLVGRWGFNPCIQNSLVYLCGGHRPDVEVYNAKSNEFRILDIDLGSEGDTCLAVIQTGTLVVITDRCSYWWDLKENQVTSQRKLDQGLYACYSWSTPVVHEGLVYVVQYRLCTSFSLSTGELINAFRQ